MRTHDLIQALSENLRPVSPRDFSRDLLTRFALGVAATLGLFLFGLGGHLDVARAAYGAPLLIKWLYTAPLCAGGCLAVLALARPDRTFPVTSWLALSSIILLAGLAVVELTRAAPAQWPALWLGQSWRSCAGRILWLSIPIFAALTWKVRQGAPTRLRLAGAAVGLASGAAAATVYALGCSETSACFVLLWYSLGVGGSAAIGAALGPLLLRW